MGSEQTGGYTLSLSVRSDEAAAYIASLSRSRPLETERHEPVEPLPDAIRERFRKRDLSVRLDERDLVEPLPEAIRERFRERASSIQPESTQPKRGKENPKMAMNKGIAFLVSIAFTAVGLIAMYTASFYRTQQWQAYNNTDAGKLELQIEYCKVVGCAPQQGAAGVPPQLAQAPVPGRVTLAESGVKIPANNWKYTVPSRVTTYLIVGPSRRNATAVFSGPAKLQVQGKQFWTPAWDTRPSPNTIEEVLASDGAIALTSGNQEVNFVFKE